MRLYKLLLTNNECYIRGVPMTPVGVMVHSTGADNPDLKRYVQPNDGRLGVNGNGNHFNTYRPGGHQVCVHAFIGKLANGSVATYQTLPWAMRGWHSGKGRKGSANNLGYIGFEICEDDLTDGVYFAKVYREAVELTAHLCKLYGLDPLKDGVVICHSEGHKRGIASNHGDVMHWFPRYGKSMDTFRADVAAEMKGGKEEEITVDEFVEKLTDEQAYELLEKAYRHANTLEEPLWSRTDGHWAKAKAEGITDGTAPERPMKRCEVIAVLGRKGLL